MNQTFSRIVAIALLSVTFAIGAGATCFLSAWPAPSASAGCHPVRIPSNPQPADYRCCISRHTSALLTNVFSPRPVLQPVEANAIGPIVTAHESGAFPAVIAPSGDPPGVTALRI